FQEHAHRACGARPVPDGGGPDDKERHAASQPRSGVFGPGEGPDGQHARRLQPYTTINRKDWGLSWNVALETGGLPVGEQIKIALEIEALLLKPAAVAVA